MSFDALLPETFDRLSREWPYFYLLLEGGLDKKLEKRINTIDPFTHRLWLYEDTEYDHEKEKGPLLVWADAGSPLLDAFARNGFRNIWE